MHSMDTMHTTQTTLCILHVCVHCTSLSKCSTTYAYSRVVCIQLLVSSMNAKTSYELVRVLLHQASTMHSVRTTLRVHLYELVVCIILSIL